jgi:hypothetical protein
VVFLNKFGPACLFGRRSPAGRAFRFKPSLRGFWKKPACAEFISVWQSVEHIAEQTRKAGFSTALPNANRIAI